MKYLAFLGIWLACYFGPLMAGDWYDTYFHLNQSAVSLVLLYAVDKLCSGWWVPEYKCLCAIHIIHNAGHAFFPFPAQNYIEIQGVINAIELFLITIGPLSILLYTRWRNGRNPDTRGTDRGPAAFSTASDDAR